MVHPAPTKNASPVGLSKITQTAGRISVSDPVPLQPVAMANPPPQVSLLRQCLT